MRLQTYSALAAVLAIAPSLAPSLATAQQPTRRRQAPIEIRGAVPTPQVVTVRPRAVPAYSRQVLVPRFFDHDFWPQIEQGYQLLADRQFGRLGLDTAIAAQTLAIGLPDLLLDSASTGPAKKPKPPQPTIIHVKRQMAWCAPHWWCPTERVTIKEVPADTTAPTSFQGNAFPKERWCTPHWWCPEAPIKHEEIKVPADTTKPKTGTPSAPQH